MISVKLNEFSNTGPKQRAIGEEAVRILERVLNAPEFAERVRGNRYSRMWRLNEDGNYDQATPDQLLELILTGKELKTEPDLEIDLWIRLAKMKKGVYGSAAIGGPIITTAYWFINDCIKINDPVRLAAHWMHEWVHTAGFYHEDRMFDDAAYDTGEIVESLGRAAGSAGLKARAGALPMLKDLIGPAVTIGDVIYETGRSLSDSEETAI